MIGEVLIGVGLTVLGGLCFLLWNTDGSLDFLAGVIAAIAFVVAIAIFAHDLALAGAAADLPMLRGELHGAVRNQIRSREIGGLPAILLLGVAVFSCCLPPIMMVARRSRLKS
ncbi:hypothetical protein COA17_11170 [Sphingomonas ginsenosidimutans]|uniref:Uncharacterized protein n=1 Tax=Sphingomonas ginsenosidimutans TaxID=862134 RepID=A0A2A4HXS8_9SPHN|nr:hypothetical protein [Sphingomonas ginsenosidimutans]PCG08709.1 hypothetical protein COA17_11170 [Sphingomonas ginsenosidimutans]